MERFTQNLFPTFSHFSKKIHIDSDIQPFCQKFVPLHACDIILGIR